MSDSGNAVTLVEQRHGDEGEDIPCTADAAPATSIVDVPQRVVEATKVRVIYEAENGAVLVLLLA